MQSPLDSSSAPTNSVRIRLEPLSVELELPRGSSLIRGLSANGVEFPCGGMGECVGCQIRVLSGSLPVTEADAAALTPDQLANGWRLACQARAHEPVVLECAQWQMQILADDNSGNSIPTAGDLLAKVAPSFSASAVADTERVGDRTSTALCPIHSESATADAKWVGEPPSTAPCPIHSESATADTERVGDRTSTALCPIHSESTTADSKWVGKQSSSRLAIAIDLGTTTIAAQLIDSAGNVLAVETALNPQTAFGSDVMSRIRSALDGQDLTTPIRTTLGQLVARLAARQTIDRASQVSQILLVGNTVMHHLFCSLDVEPLAHVPFQSPHLAEQRFTPRDLNWHLNSDCVIRFARCIGGFVGSDILAGIVAAGIAYNDDLTALVDLGTNGEIAIGNRHGIVCASAAAGPAFEAGSIRMGMRAVTGAIAYVTLADNTIRPTVIGEVAPRGICGSGLVDAVSAGLRSGAILPNGRIADGSKIFRIAPPVVLYQSDMRELQLAKGAIAAGFRLLLKRLAAKKFAEPTTEIAEQAFALKGHALSSSEHAAETVEPDGALKGHDFSRAETAAKKEGALAPEGTQTLRAIHLAGAFGNYIQIESALRIGLLEAPHAIIHAAGNTALRGAKMLLLSGEPTLPPIEHISLAADPDFEDEFTACMSFPEKFVPPVS